MNASRSVILTLYAALLLCAPTATAQQWVATYAGHGYAADAADVPSGMVVDAAGNAYISGTTRGGWSSDSSNYLVMKYDANGTQQWIRSVGRWLGCMRRSEAMISAPILDGDHNIYVVAKPPYCLCIENCLRPSADFNILAYSPAGALLLDITYDAHDQGTTVPVVQLDAVGNLYVAGVSHQTSDSADWTQDLLLLKYDPSGTLLWERRHSDTSEYARWNDPDVGLVVDAAGNAYVAGSMDIDSTGADVVVMKYDTAGNLLWFQRYDHLWDSTYHGAEHPSAMRIDDTGNVYLVCRSTGAGCMDCCGPDHASAILKYDSDGNLLWNVGTDMYTVYAVELDPVGYVYLGGLANFSVSGGHGHCSRDNGDFGLQKYAADGTMLWSRAHKDPVAYEIAIDVKVDGEGNVYLTGNCTNASVHLELGTVMYDLDGNLLWDRHYDWPSGSGDDVAVALAVNDAGEVHVTGTCRDDSTGNDFITLKYRPCFVAQAMYGDMNEDFVLTSTDIIYLVNYVFKSGDPPPICDIFGDVQCDGPVNSADIIYMVNHIFKGGPPPCAEDPCSHPLAGGCP